MKEKLISRLKTLMEKYNLKLSYFLSFVFNIFLCLSDKNLLFCQFTSNLNYAKILLI